MNEIKEIIDDLGIAALENNIKIAGVAVISDSGALVFQTDNWDLNNQTNVILDVMKGKQTFTITETEFAVVETSAKGIIGSSSIGMGHIVFVPFQGGVLIAYAMPQADPLKALDFLQSFAEKLNGKI